MSSSDSDWPTRSSFRKTRHGLPQVCQVAGDAVLVRLGKVKPIVGARLPLEQLNEALRLAHNAEIFGRIMLDVTEEVPS